MSADTNPSDEPLRSEQDQTAWQRRFPIHLNCPHCQSPIEPVVESAEEEVVCPSCGSSFHIDPDRTQDWSKDKLPKLDKFELIEAVGRGAFGTVYRARDKRLERIVAVKVPRSGQLATEEDEDRFVREARNAAQLQHPGIVPVYEVGRGESFPYIVSEFVEGTTLADILTARRFGFRESAKLVAQVAAALEHAHAQGVVHRDLKPANIMLTADGSPRVMDFGLAKRDAGEITMTFEGQVLGTPAYMSPEQAAGQSHHVDGRSDIYSLGGILYELLTGELPFRGNQRMLLHQVLNDEPRSPHSLNDRIPRDLETISLKAMSKEPSRRYQTAQALAEDLTRYLAGQPISARPVGRIERTWRWCRRNPSVASLSAAVVVVLLAGTTVSTIFGIEAEAQAREALAEKARADTEREKAVASQALEAHQRQRAQEAEAQATEDARRAGIEAEKAQQVARFLAKMFEEFAPFEFMGLRFGRTQRVSANAALTAREMLDRGAERVATELQDQPLVQAALKETIGNVYLGLGMIEKAEVLLQEALELRGRHLPREHLDTASNLHSIGLLRFSQQQFVESASCLEEALAIRRKLLGADHELVDASRMALAIVFALVQPHGYADIPEATKLCRDSLAWRRKHFGNAHRETAVGMLGLAGSLLQGSVFANWQNRENFEAARLILEATPILLSDPATKSLGLVIVQFGHAEMMTRLGQRAASIAAARRGLAAAREAVDDSHPFMQIAKVEAMYYFVQGGQLDDAEKLYQECLTIVRERNFPLPAQVITQLKRIAGPLERRDPARAEALYRQTISLTREALARRHARRGVGNLEVGAFLYAVVVYAPMLTSGGRTEEAESLYRESLALVNESTNDAAMMILKSQIAQLRYRQGKLDEAERLYRENLQTANAITIGVAGYRDRWIARNMVPLADCLVSKGSKQEAEKMYREVIALADNYFTPKAECSLALLLWDQGHDAEATKLLRHALTTHPTDDSAYSSWLRTWMPLYTLMKQQGADKTALMALIDEAKPVLASARKSLGNEDTQVATILVNMGNLLSDQGEFQRAEPLLSEAVEIREKVLSANDPEQASGRACLGQCLVGMARYEQAERLLLTGYLNLESTLGPKHERTVEAAKQLVRLYDAWQRPEKAEEYRKPLPTGGP